MDFETLSLDPSLAPSYAPGTLTVPEGTLRELSRIAFERIAFTFPKTHLDHLRHIALNPVNSANDRMVSGCLLENAIIASGGVYPLCQDTGTAQVFAWKDEGVVTGADDRAALAAGAEDAYTGRNP